ncbi:hypothetical protein L6164_031315 [Bauhinia variegata]|uniref:Uncharacterized protein n=1 Tax=Bauhinia variegata TaxID=167791 RepID=A0ACB9LFJ2_BAUVA|nr:hypothetical protein L6164_031315 [Bauhinia variegata]
MRHMGLACFCFLLLVLFLFKTSSAADGSAKFQNFRSGSMPKPSSAEAEEGFRPYQGEDGTSDEVLGDEKRKIYTGPNPLHNR